MIVPRPEDAKHKYQMFRLLTGILDDNSLANKLYFKGGTCAALRGIIDRFSVDLDFDLLDKTEMPNVRQKLEIIFKDLGLTIKDQSRKHLQFFLRYQATEYERNTLKLEINDAVSPENTYEPVLLGEIQRYCQAQTVDTMVANKLFAATARFDNNGTIAGRDFYDLHHFYMAGLPVNQKVVEERTGLSYKTYIDKLIAFIQEKLTDELLYEDLNPLLPATKLKAEIKYLKTELMGLLKDEIKYLT